jgi:hypothetical protein
MVISPGTSPRLHTVSDRRTGSRPAPLHEDPHEAQRHEKQMVTMGKRNVGLSSLIGIMWRKLPSP